MKSKTLRREYLSTLFRGNKLAYCAMLLTSILFSLLNLAAAWLLRKPSAGAVGFKAGGARPG